LIASILEEDFFQDHLDQVVRVNLDGEQEKLDDLLNRVIAEHREDIISWIQLLGFFSKRGKASGYNDISVSPSKNPLGRTFA